MGKETVTRASLCTLRKGSHTKALNLPLTLALTIYDQSASQKWRP